jgi:hypothetical protein
LNAGTRIAYRHLNLFRRCPSRKKNGKLYRCWSVVESRRTDGGRPARRQVLYLGEINDRQEPAGRRSIKVFDEEEHKYRPITLFPSDRPIPEDQANALSLVLTKMRLLRPRSFGDGWLSCLLWEELGLSSFWDEKLGGERGDVPWARVLQLLAVNRLGDPGGEFSLHRQRFLRSAMDELLEVDLAVAEKDRLYRCMDRMLPHKDELCQHRVEPWRTLFDANFDILLYDLTRTYFEGSCAEIPKAKHGDSRDGLPLAYKVLAGNTADTTTLKEFLAKVEKLCGKVRRVRVMDRGVPSEATLRQMREEDVAYRVGTPQSLLSQLEKDLLEKPWEQVHEGMAAELLEHEGERHVLARSSDRQKKETAIRRRKLKDLIHGLNRLKPRAIGRDPWLERVAVLWREAGRVASFIEIRKPKHDEPVNRRTFACRVDRAAWKKAPERDGCHILRGHIPWEDGPAEMEKRVEAHLRVALLAYGLTVSLRMKLKPHAPGWAPRAVLQSFSAIQKVEVQIPTTDGGVLVLPRHTEPEAGQSLILAKLKLRLPPQPRIRSGQLELPGAGAGRARVIL